jgi:hypothetical protein
MTKTGESYTAARAQILRKSSPKTASAAAKTSTLRRPSSIEPLDYARLAGMSDAVLKKNTGCTWARWVPALDALGAPNMSHRDIAHLVREKYKIDGWWSQMVTVGYERIKGLRERGQRRDGTYEVSRSRTYSVPVGALFDAWSRPRVRRRWLESDGVKVRTAAPSKSMRLGWTDGTIVVVGFTAKSTSKSIVSVAHTKLRDRESAERLKRYWSERLDRLGEVLARR